MFRNRWFQNCFYRINASLINSCLNCPIISPKNATPFWKCFRNSFNRNANIISFVVCLFKSCHPMNVSRKIAFIVINSVKSVRVAWCRWYLGSEHREFQPSWVNRNSSSTIVFPGRAGFACTTLHDVMMGSIELCSSRLSLMTVLKVHEKSLAIKWYKSMAVNHFGQF